MTLLFLFFYNLSCIFFVAVDPNDLQWLSKATSSSTLTRTAVSSSSEAAAAATTATDNTTRIPTKSSPQSQNRQCRVIIEDKVDFHFEVIESIVKRYPLPLHKFDCDHENQPIHVQFSLYHNRVEADQLNKTMYWTWYQYYDKYLKGKIIDRFDGSNAHIGEMITYSQYSDSMIDAIIVVTCDCNSAWYQSLKIESNKYCVLHGTIDKPDLIYKPNDGREGRLCWLNPMFKDKCYFLPIDLPSRELLDHDDKVNEMVPPLEDGEIRVCVIGNKDFMALAELLLSIGPDYLREHQVKVHVLTRKQNRPQKFKRRIRGLLDDIVSIVLDEPFLPFQRRISQCSMILPMVDPETKSRYFPGDLQKLTGSIIQLIVYKVPSVMREELYEIYRDYLIGIPLKLHRNGIDSFVSATKTMIMEIQSNKTLVPL